MIATAAQLRRRSRRLGPPGILRRRGTATMETVLVIPFILFFLLAIFLVTKYQARNQSAAVMTRYAAWQKASLAPQPSAFSTLVSQQGQNISQGNANPQLNRMFFGDNATNIFMDYDRLEPFDVWESQFITGAQMYSNDKDMTDAYLSNYFDDVIMGSNAYMLITHRDTKPQSSIFHAHSRIGNDWTYAANWAYRNPDRGTPTLGDIEYRRPYHNQLYYQDYITTRRYPADNLNAIRFTFFPGFDATIDRYRTGGNPIARLMSNMYLRHTYYHGPDIPIDNRVLTQP